MSVFSDTLKKFIEDKNVKVQPMAEYCGLERSTLYKFMNGKRDPGTPDLVEKLAQYMRLTPAETQKLQNAWKIVRIGEDIYYARKSIENFICSFPPPPNFAGAVTTSWFSGGSIGQISAYNGSSCNESFDKVSRNCVVLTSAHQVNHYVHQLLLEEFSGKSGTIDLFLQPEYPFLFSLLASLQPVGDVQIRHIFCLNNTPDFLENHELRSLYYLRQLIPVYLNRVNYETFYFYDHIDTHFQSLNLLPCMILTHAAAILCTADYQTGICFRDPGVIVTLRDLFQGYLNRCAQPFSVIKITPDNYFSVVHSVYDLTDDGKLITLEQEACLQPFLSDSLVDEIINRELQQPEMLAEIAKKTFQLHRLRLSAGKLLIYFTGEGLLHFSETGLISEIPEFFYTPLTVRQRLSVLEQILLCCQNGSYRILRKPLNRLPKNLHLFIRGTTLCDLNYNSNDGSAILLSVKEPGLLGAFQDYLTHLDEELFYPAEQSAASVRDIIRRVKDME